MTKVQHLAELKRELEQLKQQLPKHGLKPSTLARLDELEEEIAQLEKELVQQHEKVAYESDGKTSANVA